MSFRALTAPTARRARQSPRREALRNTTLREFDGGWNVIDSDLNLSSKYAKLFRNVVRAADGTIDVRFGTRLFARVSAISKMVNMTYFANALICVGADGVVVAVLGDGANFVIFDDNIASALSGAPSGWGATEFVSFGQFRGELVVSNGIDKPLKIDRTLTVQYLVDEATGSNINTPIGRYVTTADRYVIFAGISSNTSLLKISATNTIGTFPGDPDPNDSIEFDCGSFVPFGSPVIKGIHTFRDRLIVSFEEVILVVSLGQFDDNGDHAPQVDDVVPQHGSVSHRAIQDLGDDAYFCDIRGVPSIKRSVFTSQVRPERVSELIDPALQERLSSLSTATLEDRVFSVYNRTEGQYMLFVPNNNNDEDITETIGFVYTRIDALKVKAWSEIRGWNWRCGCRSSGGRVFFANTGDIYVYGGQNDPVYADFVYAYETFDDDTVFTDGTGFIVTDTQLEQSDIEEQSGLPVKFDWILPWADFERRTNNKHLRYVSVDSTGEGEFTLDVFVDNFLTSNDELGEPFLDGTFFTDNYGFENEDVEYTPELSIPFRGGDAPGFGLQPFGQTHFGGGRRSNDERLYAATSKFKLIKLRIHGQTRKQLKFVSIALEYMLGSIRR